jgi:DNA-binding NtrC family response regulator
MDIFDRLRNMTILLIDDDEWIRDSLSIFFESEGCHILALETAEEGLSALESRNFDLLIVDYKLPGMDGLELLKRIQHEHCNAIKILITAYRNDRIVTEAKKLNIQGFIQKPFTSETLMASLTFLIEVRDCRKQKNLPR